ncbi:MAG: hypothetical protein U9Q76_10730 [candidate division WOR-3 bacterium]|nr:hypothetical protein [candidate division WOR-3 bacterium]
MRIRSWFVTLVFLNLGFLSNCRKPHEPVELPLVLSIPLSVYTCWSDDYDFVLTDSLVCMLRYTLLPDSTYQITVQRVPFSQAIPSDSLILPFRITYTPSDPTFIQNYFQAGFGVTEICPYPMARQGLVFSRLPLGDTSNMLRFGHIWSIGSPPLARDFFEHHLRKYDELFYVVDIHAPDLKTKAAIEGTVLGYEYPYLLVLTGYGYHASATNIGYIKEYSSNSRLVVIDLLQKEEVVSQPLAGDSWGARLTSDNRLLYCYQDFRDVELEWDSSSYAYQRLEITEWQLESGDSAHRQMLVPLNSLVKINRGVLEPSTFVFNTPDGKALFLQASGGWGCHSPGFYGFLRSFFPGPGVSDLESPPYEVTWLKKAGVRGRLTDWWLSPERRWIVLHYFTRNIRDTGRVIFAPIEVLTDPKAFKPRSFFKVQAFEGSIFFFPREDWVLINKYDDSPFLVGIADPSRDRRIIPLLTSNEEDFHRPFFSPDGRYTGYICRLEGENLYRLQVRRLPP